MEELPHLGSSSNPSGPNSLQVKYYNQHSFLTQPVLKSEAGSSQYLPQRQAIQREDFDAIKAKIISHPKFPTLLGAYMDCQKIGAPPAVVDRFSTLSRELNSHPCSHRHESSSDPELDRFMEAYCDMLVKYQEELTKPIQEAANFFKRVETQLGSLTSDEKCEVVGSSEEDQEASGGEGKLLEIDPRTEEKELKHHLLKKYSGYIGSLRQELSKKKKKGKLPREARQKLLSWWELHYKWPYPSETEKVALAETTGLDQKQINNWFINQRKRHWKPSEDMQFVVVDSFHPPSTATLFMEGQFTSNGMYRFGP